MIFADKLIMLRKKSGWSQEELANQLNVSRQSVSKWEGAQSIPDLDKIIKLSEIFGVSTDFLLKDTHEEIEQEEYIEEKSEIRKVSMEDANNFLKVKQTTSKSIAYAVFLCIISPICLLVLGVMSEVPKYNISENAAGGIGLIIMFILAAVAVAIFILSGSKTEMYEFLEKEVFETEYGVTDMVKQRKSEFKPAYTRNNIIGTILCILSVVPFFIGMAVNEDDEMLTISMMAIFFIIAGIGVIFFIRGGIVWESYEKLLQEGEYSKKSKETKSFTAPISAAFWCAATAIYLAYSFYTNDWGTSWIVWPVAGVLYPAVITIANLFAKDNAQ